MLNAKLRAVFLAAVAVACQGRGLAARTRESSTRFTRKYSMEGIVTHPDAARMIRDFFPVGRPELDLYNCIRSSDPRVFPVHGGASAEGDQVLDPFPVVNAYCTQLLCSGMYVTDRLMYDHVRDQVQCDDNFDGAEDAYRAYRSTHLSIYGYPAPESRAE